MSIPLICGTILAGWMAFVCRWTMAAEPAPQAAASAEPSKALSFDPLQCKYLDLIQGSLHMTDAESELFQRQGFVVIDHPPTTNFGDAYYRIYGHDLPVLVTSDSLLHIMHRSFDSTLQQVETTMLVPALHQILKACHDEVGRRTEKGISGAALDNYRDVDLYLTVALNLLTPRRGPWEAANESNASKMDQEAKVAEILELIRRGELQSPLRQEWTQLFGGRRAIDYSQFKPRGHYAKDPFLQNYFRAMMWLGRADCGWFPLGAHPVSEIYVDQHRELCDAVLLTDLLAASGQAKRLEAVDHTIELFLGDCDNLRPQQFRKILDDAKIASVADLKDPEVEARLRAALLHAPAATQRIPSQVIMNQNDHPGEEIPPPALFQMLGQRFAVDSFALASVVFDHLQTVDRQGHHRWMPRSLDALAALGNPQARELLTDDLERWHYEPQLDAARDFTASYLSSAAGQRSVYDLWLAALPTLHADMTGVKNFPEVMRTKAWRLKQLNTQLASWAELRHDGILYVKQSYTHGDGCDYPAGFVEPYPDFYARLEAMANRMATSMVDIEASFDPPGKGPQNQHLRRAGEGPRKFWLDFATMMSTLRRLANLELEAKPFSADDQQFLRRTIDIHSSRDPDYDATRTYTGWYCSLLYPKPDTIDQFQPTVADVHTDSNAGEVLEAGVGRAKLAVVAIDNGADRMAFVGPVYSYYEFTRPATDRMTDEEFKQNLLRHAEPKRPDWTQAFELPRGTH